MYSTLFTVALFIAPLIKGVIADFAISSPDLVQCQSSKISWAPSVAPYNLIVVPADQPCGDALVDLGDFTGTVTNWVAALQAGTQVVLSLVDANDNEAWSKNITVGASSDTSCLSAAQKPSSSSQYGNGSPTPNVPAAAAASDPTPTTSVSPVGAANAGTNPFSGASARQASTPLMVLTAFAAAIAMSL